MNAIPIEDILACLRREVAMRKRVYPRLIAGGKLTPEKADHEIVAMEAAKDTILLLHTAICAYILAVREYQSVIVSGGSGQAAWDTKVVEAERVLRRIAEGGHTPILEATYREVIAALNAERDAERARAERYLKAMEPVASLDAVVWVDLDRDRCRIDIKWSERQTLRALVEEAKREGD